MENGQAVTNYRCPISAAHAEKDYGKYLPASELYGSIEVVPECENGLPALKIRHGGSGIMTSCTLPLPKEAMRALAFSMLEVIGDPLHPNNARAARVEPLWAKIKELGINPPKGLDVSTGLVADFWYPRRMGDDYTGQYDIYLLADKDDKSRWFYAIKGDPNRELPIDEMIAAIQKFPNWKEVRLDGGILPQGD